MRTILLILLFSLTVNAEEFQGTVVKVTDGDTVQVMRDGKAVKVRLEGIDCPEKKQAFGSKATEFTLLMVVGKEVTVQVNNTDRYGRLIGEVKLGEKSLNAALLSEGLAWWYKDYAKKNDKFRDLEAKARKDKVGLWSDPNAIPPWEFRKAKLLKKEPINANKN